MRVPGAVRFALVWPVAAPLLLSCAALSLSLPRLCSSLRGSKSAGGRGTRGAVRGAQMRVPREDRPRWT